MKSRLTFLMLWATSLFAADFWTETPFYKWSDQEVGHMLTDSPWARKAEVYVKGKATGAGLIVRWQTAVPIRQAVARFHCVDFAALKAEVKQGAHRIKRMRVGIYQRYRGGNVDEGWTRLLLEQFGFPYTSVMDAEIKKGNLNQKYDLFFGGVVGAQSPQRCRMNPRQNRTCSSWEKA